MDDPPDRGYSRAPELEDLVALCRSLNRERALKRAMKDLPDNAVAEVKDGDIGRYRVVRVADEIVVDLMAEACGIGYREAVEKGVETRRLGDVDIPVASKPLLILMKDTIRDSDKADAAFLRARIEGETR